MEYNVGVLYTENIMEDVMKNKETKDITQEQKNEYPNPLLNILSNKELTQENFFLYKKDIKGILEFLLWEVKYLWKNLNTENIKDELRTKEIFSLPYKKQELLWEYCYLLKQDKNIAAPYQYLWSIAHNSRSIISNIQSLINDHNETIEEKQEKKLNGIKEIIQSSIKSIEDKLKKINALEFTENWFYIKKDFSPYKRIETTINNNIGDIQNKNIQINNNLPKDLNIKSYKDIFEEVIENLISNAIKFTPKWWNIEIWIENENENEINFFVKDSWIGIVKDSEIFSQWYTTPSIEGKEWTGLGLTHSKLFLEISWGYLSYKKNTPQWTIFTFSLKKDNPEKHLQN